MYHQQTVVDLTAARWSGQTPRAMFASSVFSGLFGKVPSVKNGKVAVHMSAKTFATFSAKWAELGGANNRTQGFFYNEKIGVLQAWG